MSLLAELREQHLGRNLALELGPRSITSNVVVPGFFPSKLASGLIEKLGGQKELNVTNSRGRLGEAEDIVGVMIYLCWRAGNYMFVFLDLAACPLSYAKTEVEKVLVSLLMAELVSLLVDTQVYNCVGAMEPSTPASEMLINPDLG